jgi:hypothetical protein
MVWWTIVGLCLNQSKLLLCLTALYLRTLRLKLRLNIWKLVRNPSLDIIFIFDVKDLLWRWLYLEHLTRIKWCRCCRWWLRLILLKVSRPDLHRWRNISLVLDVLAWYLLRIRLYERGLLKWRNLFILLGDIPLWSHILSIYCIYP